MLDHFIATLTSPEVGGVLLLMTVLLIADFVTGISRAVRVKVFEWSQIADFVGTHVVGRWLGIVVLVALAPLSPAIVAVSGLAVAAYTAETLASIKENITIAPPA